MADLIAEQQNPASTSSKASVHRASLLAKRKDRKNIEPKPSKNDGKGNGNGNGNASAEGGKPKSSRYRNRKKGVKNNGFELFS